MTVQNLGQVNIGKGLAYKKEQESIKDKISYMDFITYGSAESLLH